MKHTDFTKQIEETKRAEACELLSALIAHGGSYTFPKSLDLTIRMGTDRPRVVGAEANGCSVSLTLESMFGSEQYITNAFEAWPGEMSKITEAIPPTSRVHDVSADIQSALGGIELYDIDEIGYSTEGITQDILDQIAEKMVEDYTHGERRKDLERALIEQIGRAHV